MILIISSQVVNSVLLAQVGAARFLNDFSAIILLVCKILMLHVSSKVWSCERKFLLLNLLKVYFKIFILPDRTKFICLWEIIRVRLSSTVHLLMRFLLFQTQVHSSDCGCRGSGHGSVHPICIFCKWTSPSCDKVSHRCLITLSDHLSSPATRLNHSPSLLMSYNIFLLPTQRTNDNLNVWVSRDFSELRSLSGSQSPGSESRV